MDLYDGSGAKLTGIGQQERDYFCAFSLFNDIGVVGDSYANGYCGESAQASSGVNHPEISWPQVLARRNGVNVTNYATGGLSTASFITNATCGLSKLQTDAAKGLYILALERNDFNRENGGETGYIGAITDITGHSLGSYPDTFFGNYATIIETIQAKSAAARLVMMSGDYTSAYPLGQQYNAAMEAIAAHYSIPIMKQLDDPYFASGNSYYRNKPAGGHPGAIAYCGMELAIERLFNQCVKDYRDYFLYFIGTPGA